MIRLKYVNKDHSHRFYGKEGNKIYHNPKKGVIKNTVVRLDSGELVCAPFNNWRRVKEENKS